jgi:hypothetical protein
MNCVVEQKIEKYFSLVAYYYRLYQQRRNKSYLDVAASYCQDLLELSDLVAECRDKAYFLYALCLLENGYDEAPAIKEKFYSKAASCFFNLTTFGFHELEFDEIPKNLRLIEDLFAWNKQNKHCNEA